MTSGTVQSVSPFSGETIATYDIDGDEEVRAAIETAHARHQEWRRVPIADRGDAMRRLGDELDGRVEELAGLMADEMGKPLAEGRSEVEKCAWVCRYYADHAGEQLADVHVATERHKSYIHYEPLGVVLAVMPWNFPLWQVMRFAAPNLMAGNAGLLKHASNVTGSAVAIQDMIEAAGVPDGLFRTLVLPSDRVEAVIEHPLVRAVTLTGSEPAGRAVAAAAGRALKKTVLELGGSDPYVVLADADITHAARVCAKSRLINGGQSCISAKRFVVDDAVHDDFVDRLVEEMGAPVQGDPRDESTDIGPMARPDLRDELHEQVQQTIEAGATRVIGGEVPGGQGAFYPPTVLTGVELGMVAADEELFGPVAAVMRADDVEDAIRIANATSFGLGAAVFTDDLARGEEIAATRLHAGSCFVNALVASDPRLPFGGINDSGYGRELSHLGITEFVNAKTVVVERPAG